MPSHHSLPICNLLGNRILRPAVVKNARPPRRSALWPGSPLRPRSATVSPVAEEREAHIESG